MAYKSKGEIRVAKSLRSRNVKFLYEPVSLHYILECDYTPDFLLPNGIFVEYKGKLDKATMRKHRAVAKQHPELDIRFVFENAKKKIRKGAKTNYGEWATKNGFLWEEGDIPNEWLQETNGKKK